jgi:hypothetical protein
MTRRERHIEYVAVDRYLIVNQAAFLGAVAVSPSPLAMPSRAGPRAASCSSRLGLMSPPQIVKTLAEPRASTTRLTSQTATLNAQWPRTQSTKPILCIAAMFAGHEPFWSDESVLCGIRHGFHIGLSVPMKVCAGMMPHGCQDAISLVLRTRRRMRRSGRCG